MRSNFVLLDGIDAQTHPTSCNLRWSPLRLAQDRLNPSSIPIQFKATCEHLRVHIPPMKAYISL
eukprot:scaffold121433_cov47-Attheya_sp.AAC.1